ncbi:MAG: hypothetical protein HFJ65_04050 [Eggerthellaceae bacterium]|nr:hypothetical protein [Eggerthellaceae bacterium]
MAEGFSHIKVTPAEEAEVVIHAGAPCSSSVEEGQAAKVPDKASEDAAFAKSAPVKSAARSQDAFKETTLEDIQGSKMSKMQIAIIVVAVLAIVAFIVWYAFLS